MGTTSKRFILKHVFIGLAVYLGAFSLSHAQSETTNTRSRDRLNSTQELAEAIIHSLPDSGIKQGLLKYYSILAPHENTADDAIGVNNQGIAGYLEKNFAENQCFAEAALNFYGDLRKNIKHTQISSDGDKNRHARASLGDISGITRPDLPAGWLFKKALYYAQGDANVAISLIGLCGHDDKEQGVFKNDKALQAILSKGGSFEDYYEIEDSEEQYQILCLSQESDLYLAQSLDRHSDISESLKKEINQTQYPGKTPFQVASKNYHVLGAAFMTCQMIEAGMPKAMAVQLQATASSLYRGIRLCEDIKRPTALFNALMQEKEVIYRDRNSSFEDTVIDAAMKRASTNACASTDDAFCGLLRVNGRLSAEFNDSFVRGRLATQLNKTIASALYSQWFAGGSVMGVELPCTHAQFFGPPEFIRNALVKGNIKANICGNGLDVASCKKALEVIHTWTVDFDWTISQHRAGAVFAAKVCTSRKQSSFEGFCKGK